MRSLILLLFVLLLGAHANGTVNDSSKMPIEASKLMQAADQLLQDNPDEALKVYQQALLLCEDQPATRLKADLLSKVGYAHYLIGDNLSALESQTEALQRYEHLGIPQSVAHEYSQIANTYYFSTIRNIDKAEECYKKARDLYQKLGLISESALNLNNLGYIAWGRDEPEKALAIHQQAYSTFEGIDDKKGMATALSDIGFTLNSLERYEEALPYHFEALELETELRAPLMRIPTLNNIGISYLHLGKLEEALPYSRSSLRLAEERNIYGRQKEASATLHQILAAMDRHAEAYQVLLKHEQLITRIQQTRQTRKLLEQELEARFRQQEEAYRLEAKKEREITEARVKTVLAYTVSAILCLILSLALIVVLWISIHRRRKAHRQLEEQQEQLREKNQQLHQSLQELKDAQAQLIHLEKRASMGILTSGISHEINNSMNYIRGSAFAIAQEIKQEHPDTAVLEEMLSHIDEGVKKSTRIVDTLTRFSSENKVETRPIPLMDCLQDSVLLLGHKLDDKVKLDPALSESDLKVFAKESNLLQVIANVLKNADDATDENGTISIRAHCIKDQKVEIIISDNGRGIPEDDLKHIYDPFYTTKDPDQGTGIGLAISLTMLRQMNGSMRHTSTIGQGTTVHLTLPAAD